MTSSKPLNWEKLKVYPLAERRSLSSVAEILVDPSKPPPPCDDHILGTISECARRIKAARRRRAGVILMYGAHLVKNGAASLVNALSEDGWITHLATNGAGTIHDWELAYSGRTAESVEENVATGTFGAWDETGRWIHIALFAGALRRTGYGRSLGKFIWNEGTNLPSAGSLKKSLRAAPSHPLAPARAELLRAMLDHKLPSGKIALAHPWKSASILGRAASLDIPFTVHPGIGYDIISNHPMFNGAAIGRAAGLDFRLFSQSVETLDGGVVLSVGSAIMAPQVFEKGLSCVNNLRLQAGRRVVRHHSIYVVDLQDGGQWDWSKGEPPKDNPAYYLRFCKSFSRMGGDMRYLQCDNVVFLHQLLHQLRGKNGASA